MQARDTFGNGQGKELVVAIGNLVTIADNRAEWYGTTTLGFGVTSDICAQLPIHCQRQNNCDSCCGVG